MLNGLELWVTRNRTGVATDVVVVVGNGYEMSGYLTKEEKKGYEQVRRRQIIQDARDHRLLTKWLMGVQPDSLAKFYAFKTQLQNKYPLRKDLSKAPAFTRFLYGGDDVRFEPERMVVPLTDLLQCPKRSQPRSADQTSVGVIAPLNPDQDQQGLIFETEVGSTVPLNEYNPFLRGSPLNPDQDQQGLIFETEAGSTVPLNEYNPFCLSSEEVDELLRGLEAIGYEEVRALGEADDKLPRCSEGSNVSHYVDHELFAVLNMDVDDFVV